MINSESGSMAKVPHNFEIRQSTAYFPLGNNLCLKDKYTMRQIIHESQNTVVLRVLDKQNNHCRAIKHSFNFSEKSSARKRFKTEAKLLAQLKNKHRNLIRAFQIQEIPKESLIVYQYCDGGSLEKALKTYGPLSQQLARLVFWQLLDAVDYLHTKEKIVHRNLSLKSILIRHNQLDKLTIKLSGFQFGKRILAQKLFARVGQIQYMAPEVLGTQGYSFGRDIWSCGVILFMLLTGKPLFDGTTEIEICKNILKADIRSIISEVASSLKLTTQAESLLIWMLHPSPERRPTAKEAATHPWFSMDEETEEGEEEPAEPMHTIAKSKKIIDSVVA